MDTETLSYISGGAVLRSPSSNFGLGGGASITAAGITLINGGTLTIGGAVSILNLDLAGGTLTGGGDLSR